MSIINSFDNNSSAIINPENCLNKHEIKLDICIINFSYKIMDALIENNLLELIDDKSIKCVACMFPIYVFKGTNIGIVKTTVGAPMTTGLIEDVSYVFSCNNFIMFGSCGSLNKNIIGNSLIVPTYAYRDEGTSYHYMPASDYVEIKNNNIVCNILDDFDIPYVKGKIWTTDAFYRETQNNMELRKQDGCIAVDMELSAVQAMCDFKQINLYSFLYSADNLDYSTWQKGLLDNMPIDERLKYFYIALNIAKILI